jgi:uncharacterized protein YhaN
VKIDGWLVERFGALRNYEVRDLPDGLTVFYGPNGAGKSTLFTFLRQMVFGRHQPEAAGPDPAFQHNGYAGRLSCRGPGGVYTIARTADQPSHLHVTRPDGQEGSEADLECLLGGADGRLVGSFLMFNAQDLQALPPLSAPGIRERMLSASVGEASRSSQRALSTIQVRLSRLVRGVEGDTQGLLSTLADLQSRIDRSTRAAVRYCQLLHAQTQWRLEVEIRTRAVADLRADKARYDALVDLCPVWHELTQARHELDKLEFIDEFPDNPEERLAQALAAQQSAQRSADQLVDQEPPLHLPRERPVTIDNGGVSGEIEALFSTVAQQRARLRELAATRTDLAQVPAGPLRQFSDRGPEWDEQCLESVDRAHPGTEDLIAWQQRLKNVVEAVRDRQRELEATKRTTLDLKCAQNRSLATLNGPEPPSAAVLGEGVRLLQRVRAALAGLGGEQIATKPWQELIAGHSETIRTLETQVPRLPSAEIRYVAWFAAALGMAAAVWRYAEGDIFGLSQLSVCSVASAWGAEVQRSRRTRSVDADSRRRARLSLLRREIEDACEGLRHHQERATRRRFDISVDSARLGLPPMPSDRQLQEREAELDEQRRQRRNWDDAQAALDATLAALATSEGLEHQQAAALLESQAQQRQTIREWHQWKVDAGLADNVTSLRGSVEARHVETDLLQSGWRCLRTKVAECERAIAEWDTRARSALAAAHELDGPDATGEALVEQIVRAHAHRLQAENVRNGRVVGPQASSEHSPALQAARRRLGQCSDALAQLLSEAGASDEAVFRTRLATYRRRLALLQTIRACEIRSSERLRQEPAAHAILLELSEGNVQEWRRRAARAALELTGPEASRNEGLQQLQKIDADACSASAESAHLSVLETEQAGLKTEALETVREWRTLAIAASLVAEAQREVERKCQPVVLRRASQVFSAVTSSRYECLLQSDDRHELSVVDTKGSRTSVEQLSRATVEQLCFSLRIGLAQELAQCGSLLPLVIDDAFDTFDPTRSRAMAHHVVELGRRHQILLFTCRPETCDLLRSLDPTVNVITMQEL